MLVNERKRKVNEYTKRIVLFGPISIDILFFFFFFFTLSEIFQPDCMPPFYFYALDGVLLSSRHELTTIIRNAYDASIETHFNDFIIIIIIIM